MGQGQFNLLDLNGCQFIKLLHHQTFQTNYGENAPINGNFEKFIVNKYGKRIARLANGVLLNYAHESGYCDEPDVELAGLEKLIEEALEEEYVEETN